ncbi:MAG: ring-opening amidohydrolase [Paenibacillus sp.]|nr:ring-opening amidohydrolase [Paenibacillus sp.]
MRHEIIRLGMAHPGDVSELEKLLKAGDIQAQHIKGIIAQTEGDGYARGYSTLAFQVLLESYLGWSHEEIFDRIPMMMIGKTGGLMSPHYTLFVRRDSSSGTAVQVDVTAATVREAMADAGIDRLEDVHCVEIKCPWGVGGNRSKAASALGSGVALQEIDRDRISEEAINGDHDLYSLRTSVSAGGEQTAVRVIVMGNKEGADSPLVVSSGVMRDSFDLSGLYRVFDEMGMPVRPVLAESDRKRVRQVFVNAGADALSHIRGQRHTIHSDALSMHSGIVAKAVAHAVVGGLVGDAAILCSAGSEHQGPRGANLIAVVAEAAAEGGTAG